MDEQPDGGLLMQSVVLIVPTALKVKANDLASIMGWGPLSYSVELSAGGIAPATHYGLHTWGGDEFAQALASADAGIMPQALVYAAYPQSDFDAIMNALIASIRPDMVNHFPDICQDNSLLPVIHEGDV